MSYGAIKHEQGKYQSLLAGAAPVTTVDFEKKQYVPAQKLLNENLHLSEAERAELNAIIGRFLAIIQEASFVHRSVLEVIPPFRAPWLDHDPVYQHDPLPYGSTLSPQALTEAVRGNIAKVIRDIISLVPGLKTATNNVPETCTKKPGGGHGSLLFTVNIPHTGDMKYADLLTDEARSLIESLGPAFVNALNEILHNFAEAVLVRANLSFVSLRRDVTVLKQRDKSWKSSPPKNAEYSTLNPNDLMEMAQKFMPNVPVAILMRLPDEQARQIMNTRR